MRTMIDKTGRSNVACDPLFYSAIKNMSRDSFAKLMAKLEKK